MLKIKSYNTNADIFFEGECIGTLYFDPSLLKGSSEEDVKGFIDIDIEDIVAKIGRELTEEEYGYISLQLELIYNRFV